MTYRFGMAGALPPLTEVQNVIHHAPERTVSLPHSDVPHLRVNSIDLVWWFFQMKLATTAAPCDP